MKIFSMIAMALLAGGLLSGCAFFRNSYRGTERYELNDIPSPARLGSAAEGNVVVQAFRNLSSAGRKMAYRNASGLLVDDPYTDWAQSPERMIQCALTGYFAGMRAPAAISNVEISGSIWLFSLDWKARKARLGVSYEIRSRLNDSPDTRKIYGSLRFEAPLESRTGSAAATAMGNCVAQLAAALENKIDHLK